MKRPSRAVHGDRFDVCIRNAKWLAMLGDHAYRVCLVLNNRFNWARRRMGMGCWSLSAYLEHEVKNAVSYIQGFEEAAIDEATRRGFDGVVCGHVHHAEMRDVGGVLYCNDGDWVESCTALVEEHTGELCIVRWAEECAVRDAAVMRACVS